MANRVSRDLFIQMVVTGRRLILSAACTATLVSWGGGQSGPAAPTDSVGPASADSTDGPGEWDRTLRRRCLGTRFAGKLGRGWEFVCAWVRAWSSRDPARRELPALWRFHLPHQTPFR